MRAGLLVVGIAVLACGAAGLLLAAASARDLATGGLVLLSAAATLFLAAATAVFAWQAARRTRDMTAEIERLARSVDAALGDLAARADRERAEIAELRGLVLGEPGEAERRVERPAAASAPPAPAPRAPAVAPPRAPQIGEAAPAGAAQPAPAAPQPPPNAAQPLPSNAQPLPGAAQAAAAAPDQHPPVGAAQLPGGHERLTAPPGTQGPGKDVEAAVGEMMKAGKAELSVQPIISVARGAVRGHDVHVHVVAGQRQLHFRRPGSDGPGQPGAAFERLVLTSAADAARRRLAPANAAMPLHVAVSDALLGDESELAKVFDFLRSHAVLARSLIVSLPGGVAAADHRAALRRLAGAGIRLAVEGWDGSKAEFEILLRSGLRYLKLPADRLLDREKPSAAPPAATLLDLAAEAGVEIVATGVGTDEDAVAILNLGIDLMSGPRFSGPRLLTQESGRQPGQARVSEG